MKFGRIVSLVLGFMLFCVFAGCSGDEPDLRPDSLSEVEPYLTYLKDKEGRYIYLKGVNVGGSTKVPYLEGEDALEHRYNPNRAADLSYVGRPFPADSADDYFEQIRALGFNSVRLLFMWEAVMPTSHDEVDTEFLAYLDEIIGKAHEHGLYVLLNVHENIWSRHIYSLYNEKADGDKGDLINMLYSLFPQKCKESGRCAEGADPEAYDWEKGFTDHVSGDGAPMWANYACLPHKNWDLDNKNWGLFRILGTLGKDLDDNGRPDFFEELDLIIPYLEGTGMITLDDATKAKIREMEKNTPEPFPVTETSDMMPWTFWGFDTFLSMDSDQCYAKFFAGDVAYPGMVALDKDGAPIIDPDTGQPYPIEEYLQSGYERMWREVAKVGKKHANVIGYDIMNEPPIVFIVLSILGAYFDLSGLGLESTLNDLMSGLLPVDVPLSVPDNYVLSDDGETSLGEYAFFLLRFLEVLPRDTSDEMKAELGLTYKDETRNVEWSADTFALLGLNSNFEENHLRPFYERLAGAIVEEDPDAVIWFEVGFGLSYVLGGEGVGGQWVQHMVRPTLEEGDKERFVFSPHWYPDIYPHIGFNMTPREFSDEVYRYREYSEKLASYRDEAKNWYSNIPTVFGEFGTYWNYNGIEQSVADDYIVSTEILDNYYESYEELLLSNMVWCYTADNDYTYGDWWNHEDFSVIDPDGRPRGETAYSRPVPTAISGKPTHMHFYSDHHYYDPDKGEVDPFHEFELRFASRETREPTTLFVPELQYPDGFYVWLSDGFCSAQYFPQQKNPEGSNSGENRKPEWIPGYYLLNYYPTEDRPEWEHEVLIRPPLKGQEARDWNYFIKRGDVLTGGTRH